MDTRIFEYFLVIAREENITRAANLLHISQPALSRQMMQLEDDLGVKLFKRSKHRIFLTDEGRLFERRSQEILDLVNKTREEIAGKEEISGIIEIGLGEYKYAKIFFDMLSSFKNLYPNVQYEIYTGDARNIKDRIENGNLDFGLLLEPVDLSKYQFIRLPVKERWGAYVHENSPLAKLEYLQPSDLANQNIITIKRKEARNEVMNWLGEYQDTVKIVASCNLSYNAILMVKSEMGLSINLEKDANYDFVKFIPLRPKLESSIALAWKKTDAYSATVEAFIEYANQYLLGIDNDEN